MDSIGDWLYVVLLIIAGISSIIGSIGKKRREEAQKQEAPPDIFPDIFPEMFPEQAVEIPVAKPVTQPRRKHAPQNIFQEGVSSLKTANTEAIMPDVEEETAFFTLNDIPADTDEWRKAFVYNEIFTRKY